LQKAIFRIKLDRLQTGRTPSEQTNNKKKSELPSRYAALFKNTALRQEKGEIKAIPKGFEKWCSTK
jgi:hypothetical protein